MAPDTGFELLEQTAEDEDARIHRLRAPGGTIVQLTDRQVQIMAMSPTDKHRVPQIELIELGKMLMEASQANIDDMLRSWDETPVEVLEFVPEPYTYTPLSKPTFIRLIRLLPESEDGLVQIELQEHDLDENVPRYYSLSYAWSNPHAVSNIFNYQEMYAEDYTDDCLFPISCNGRLLHVRANLYDALQQMPEAPMLRLKKWYDVNGEPDRLNDLHISAVDGNLALVKTNIFRGADIHAKDSAGRTALVLATIKGHIDVVRILLERGADRDIRDFRNNTCLDYALIYERHEIVDLLLTFDASRVQKLQRRQKHLGRGVMLWVDAICINQNDVQEKNNQVSRMDEIYAHSHAECVALWLGKDDGHGALAVQAIEKLFPASKSKALGECEIIPYRENSPEVYTRAGISYVSMREWVSLAALYLRQNFNRLWCLQETVLQDNVVMYLGPYEIPWSEFMMVTEQLHILQQKFTVPPSTMFRPIYNHPIESEAHLISELKMRRLLDTATPERRQAWFNDTKRFWRGNGEPSQIPLLEMIMSTITFKCFDPRDHIYALIGMCKDHPDTPQVEVDYNKPFEEIYTDITRLMLGSMGTSEMPSLELVACIKNSYERDNENLPSWVLDFSQPGISSFWQPKFTAAGLESETFDVRHSAIARPHELVLQGIKVDTIKYLATKRPGKEFVTMFNFDPTWPALVLELPLTYAYTGQPRTEALWRTLCADSPATDDIVRSQHAAELDPAHEVLTTSSPAPAQYANEFRDQFCAMILSHAERAADWQLKLRTSQGGVLLQALVNLQIQEQSDGHSTIAINEPTEEELTHITDTSLTGPYFADPPLQQALADLQTIHDQDSAIGCCTPSLREVAAYLAEPKYRVWRPNALPSNSSDWPKSEQASDAQAMDVLPPGEDGFRSQFSRYTGGRRLFITDREKYLGLGGMSMREGDEVWIVKGSRVPFLLRRVDEDQEPDGEGSEEHMEKRQYGYFKLVGDLYVHGIMQGEAILGNGKWEDIVLT